MEKLRRKGHFKRPAEARGKFNDGGRTIKKRDRSVYKRKELGHWEGDTVVSGKDDRTSKSKVCFVTLAERKSRLYLAIKVPDRTAASVTPAIISTLKKYPPELVRTITFDRGKEFSGYEEIEVALNCKTYFCDPYCSRQKGTNENSNGLLREFYPKEWIFQKYQTKICRRRSFSSTTDRESVLTIKLLQKYSTALTKNVALKLTNYPFQKSG